MASRVDRLASNSIGDALVLSLGVAVEGQTLNLVMRDLLLLLQHDFIQLFGIRLRLLLV